MVINSVTFENITWGGTSQNLIGTVGDTIEATINYTHNLTPANYEYYLSFALSNEIPYVKQSGVFAINQSFFSNTRNGLRTTLKGTLGQPFKPVPPFGGFGEVVNSAPPTNTQIKHVFQLLPEIAIENYDGDQLKVPSFFSGKNCLKYIFRLEVVNVSNRSLFDNTDTLDLSSFYERSATSFIGEKLNGTPSDFSLITVPSFLQCTDIQPKGFSFLVQKKGFVPIGKVRCVYSDLQPFESDNLPEFSKYNRVEVFATNGNSASNSVIKNLNIELLPNNQAQISGEIEPQEAGVQKNITFTIDGQLIYSSRITYIADPAYPDLDVKMQFERWRGAGTGLFNTTAPFIDDDSVCVVDVTRPSISAVLNTFEFGYLDTSTGVAIESFVTPASSAFFEDRLRKRNVGDLSNYVNMSLPSFLTVWQISYGAQFWNEFLGKPCAFFLKVLGIRGRQPLSLEFRSPQFIVGGYNLTRNTAIEPQALKKELRFFKVDGSGNITDPTPLTSHVVDSNMLVEATFKDLNLNDLQVSTVFGYLGVCTDSLKGDKSQWNWIFSTKFNESGSFWREPVGHTLSRAKAEVIAIDEAKVSAWYDVNLLKETFGDITNLCFDARLDADLPLPSPKNKEITMDFRDIATEGMTCSFVADEAMPVISWSFFNTYEGGGDYVKNNFLWFINSTFFSSFEDWITALGSVVSGDVCGASNFENPTISEADVYLYIRYQTSDTSAIPTYWSLNVDVTQNNETLLEQDFVIKHPFELEVAPVHGSTRVQVIGQSDVYLNVRHIFKLWILSDIVAFNASIAAVAGASGYPLLLKVYCGGEAQYPIIGSILSGGRSNRILKMRYLSEPNLVYSKSVSSTYSNQTRLGQGSVNAYSFNGVDSAVRVRFLQNNFSRNSIASFFQIDFFLDQFPSPSTHYTVFSTRNSTNLNGVELRILADHAEFWTVGDNGANITKRWIEVCVGYNSFTCMFDRVSPINSRICINGSVDAGSDTGYRVDIGGSFTESTDVVSDTNHLILGATFTDNPTTGNFSGKILHRCLILTWPPLTPVIYDSETLRRAANRRPLWLQASEATSSYGLPSGFNYRFNDFTDASAIIYGTTPNVIYLP